MESIQTVCCSGTVTNTKFNFIVVITFAKKRKKGNRYVSIKNFQAESKNNAGSESRL